MTRHEIVRRQLRFDVRLGNDSADSNVHPLKYVRDVEIKINHRHIEAVSSCCALASWSLNQPREMRKAIIEPVEKGDAKSPVDVIGLCFIRQAFDVEHDLV